MVTSEKNTYTPSGVDLKFIKAVDYIIEKNRVAKTKPYTDNAISNTIFGSRSIIGKIRASKRGITLPQLQKFAVHFDLDFNYFFRSTKSMLYNPQAAGRNQNMGITGENVDIINEMTDSTVYRGNVYHREAEIIENVDKMMHVLPQNMEPQAAGAIGEDIKKMLHNYQEKLRIVTEQRDRAKAKQIEISEKYIKLLEQNIG